VANLVEQEQEGRLGRPAVAAALALALLASACGRSSAETIPVQALGDPAVSAGAHAEDSALPEDQVASLREVASLRAELERSRARIAELEGELTETTSRRIAREEELVRQSKLLTELRIPEKVEPKIEPARESAADIQDPAARRDHEIHISLKTLFTLDQVTGFDLLESGTLKDGATGPVVLRALDDRGRPVATLAAERMRFECSRAARTVTIVLEDGFERRGVEKTPFEGAMTAEGRGGVRRVELPETNPTPWLEALPELFREEDRTAADDDGLWDLGAVRASLNLLLREDVSAGWWRLVALGGVRAGSFRDVQLDGLDSEGRLERKLFADRLDVVPQEKGLKLELRDGAQMRGDEKVPFLEGRYRIFLPRASVGAWKDAGIPGLSDPPRPR
jgi:hypothetical protein